MSLYQRLATWARLKSPWITIFNSGACNACDIEIIATLTPRFDVERFGILAKGSPRHADILIVTGPVTRKQAPQPRVHLRADARAEVRHRDGRLRRQGRGIPGALPCDGRSRAGGSRRCLRRGMAPSRPDEIINAVVETLRILKEDVAHGGREWRKEAACQRRRACTACRKRGNGGGGNMRREHE